VEAVLGEVFDDVVAEEAAVAGGDAALGQPVGLRQDAEVGRDGVVGLGAADGARVGHGVEDVVAAGQGTVGVGVRVQAGGLLHRAGQQGRLGDGQLGGGDAEVGAGGVLHAEGA